MRTLTRLIGLSLIIIVLLAGPRSVHACPACQDAIAASGSETDDDPLREARGYNRSIYLMAGMPYLLLGTVGFLIYRGLKQNAVAARQAAPPLSGQGDRSCSTPSIADVS